MKFDELNAREEAVFRDKLGTYERVPSERARSMFESGLAKKKKRSAGRWVGGIAAALMLVGGWWFGILESQQVLPTHGEASVVEKIQDRGVNNQPISPQVVMPGSLARPFQLAQVTLQPENENRVFFEGEVEIEVNKGVEVEVMVPERAVLPIASQRPRELEVSVHLLTEVRYATKTADVPLENSRRSVSKWFEDLMVLKYGEPVEEGRVLTALFSGDESSLLVAEREELKERISWIKDKVIR